MKRTCDMCKEPVKKVGKLFKIRYLYLCKNCRKKFQYSSPIKRKR